MKRTVLLMGAIVLLGSTVAFSAWYDDGVKEVKANGVNGDLDFQDLYDIQNVVYFDAIDLTATTSTLGIADAAQFYVSDGMNIDAPAVFSNSVSVTGVVTISTNLIVNTKDGTARFGINNLGAVGVYGPSLTITGATYNVGPVAIVSSGVAHTNAFINGVNKGIMLGLHGDDLANTYLVYMDRASDSHSPTFMGHRARGTHAAPAAVAQDDILFQYCAAGWDGTGGAVGSRIRSVVDGTPGADDMPARIEFHVSADGSQVPTNRFAIHATVITSQVPFAVATGGTNMVLTNGNIAAYAAAQTVLTNALTLTPAGDVDVFGGISGCVPVTSDTDAAITLTSTDTKGKVRINGDDDVIDYTLPTAQAGLTVTFANALYARVITVDANSGDIIILNDGTALNAGDAADSSGAIDDKGTFIAIDATYWMLFSEQNTWVDGGVD